MARKHGGALCASEKYVEHWPCVNGERKRRVEKFCALATGDERERGSSCVEIYKSLVTATVEIGMNGLPDQLARNRTYGDKFVLARVITIIVVKSRRERR